MRDFLDEILAFIVATSLTDDEFSTVVSTLMIYDQASYDDLSRILAMRGSASTYQDRLTAFYKAKGVVFEVKTNASSNIFLGACL